MSTSARDYQNVLMELLEGSPDAAILASRSGEIKYANSYAEQLFGYGAGEMQKVNLNLLFTPLQEQADAQPEEHQEGRARVCDGYGRRRDGTTFLAEMRSGSETGPEGNWRFYTMHDVEERRRVEGALRESEERFSMAFQSAPVAICLTTLAEGRFLDVNESFTRLTGYRREEITGLTVNELKVFHSPLQRESELARHGRFENLNLQIRTKEGKIRDTLASAEVIDLIGEQCVLEMFADVSERRRLEREVLEAAAREQRRIGQELHDDLGQQLTAVAAFAEMIEEKLEAGDSTLHKYAFQMNKMLREARESARRLSHQLSPVSIPGPSLSIALERLAARTEKAFGIRCSLRGGGAEVADDVAFQLYRIAQEAINNAVKHAAPQTVTIDFARRKSRVVLRIEDDGKGIPENAAAVGGWGLRTMQYRADVIGASLEVKRRSRKGGTTIACVLEWEAKPADLV